MKIYRNNVGIELSLDEFINLIEDEDRIYDITELIATLEEDEMLREEEAELALEGEDAYLEGLTPSNLSSGVAVLDRPAGINQYFINVNSTGLEDEDYLNELEGLNTDELIQVRRIIKRFNSLLD